MLPLYAISHKKMSHPIELNIDFTIEGIKLQSIIRYFHLRLFMPMGK
jgi:hypothetical protein